MSTRTLSRVVVAAVAILLIAAPAAADRGDDQDRPIKMAWSGTFVIMEEGPECSAEGFVPVYFEGTGNVSHMGAVEVEAHHCANLVTGEVTLGVQVITAANEDELFGTYVGQLTPVTETEWTCVTYNTYEGGTGRFTNASGFAGPTDTWVTFTSPTAGVLGGEIFGTISYDASDRSN